MKKEGIGTEMIIKSHQKIGPIVKQLCWLFDGWIVGGSVDYLTNKSEDIPKDIDVIIPLNKWMDACKLIPEQSISNSFGGFKFNDGNFSVDVWTDDISMVIARTDVKAFQPKLNITIGII